MPNLDFVFAVHDHQPLGNFEHVLEDAHRRCYRPFLAALERHPGVKCVLHQSGILWEWMEARHPEHLMAIAQLVARGQIELLGGPYYEPLLPAVPERDRRGQLDKLATWLERRFGTRPRGAWVPERVWEPQLAASLARAGVEYVLLDDAHFEAAGIDAAALDGPWIATDEGLSVRVFPMRAPLRLLVPFAPPEEAIADLRAFAEDPRRGPGSVVVCADDGEKFGVWQGTHELCYEAGWLDRFFSRLEESAGWLRSATLSECADRAPLRGRAALAAGSYADFMEWSLPPASQGALRAARLAVTRDIGAPAAARLVRGGTWRDFLERYPEARWTHERMLQTSRTVNERLEREGEAAGHLLRAREEVWKAQCNCAYWHGLFGGVYLPHLRGAVRGALLRAERLLAGDNPDLKVQVLDVDADGKVEIVMRSRELQAFVKPDAGGALLELDDRLRCFDLLDLVARRPEAYQDGSAIPVHDVTRPGACIDRVLAAGATLESWAAAAAPELAPLASRPYEWTLGEDGVRLEQIAPLAIPGAPALHVIKTLRIDGPALEAHYEIWCDSSGNVELRFGVEMAVNFLAGDAPDRYFDVPGHELEDRRLRSRGAVENVSRIDVVDEWLGLRARFETDAPGEIWRAPVETSTRSQGGAEQVYQGSRLLFMTPVVLAPGTRHTRSVRLVVERT